MIHFQHRSRYIWYSSSLSPTHICSSLVMDRQGIPSLVYDKNDGMNNYISKASIFDLERQMQGPQSRLRERIENISIDIRHSEARKRDYIDKKLSAHKEEQDERMEEIRALIKSSSPSSSSKVATFKPQVFGARKQCKCNLSMSTSPWQPPSRS